MPTPTKTLNSFVRESWSLEALNTSLVRPEKNKLWLTRARLSEFDLMKSACRDQTFPKKTTLNHLVQYWRYKMHLSLKALNKSQHPDVLQQKAAVRRAFFMAIKALCLGLEDKRSRPTKGASATLCQTLQIQFEQEGQAYDLLVLPVASTLDRNQIKTLLETYVTGNEGTDKQALLRDVDHCLAQRQGWYASCCATEDAIWRSSELLIACLLMVVFLVYARLTGLIAKEETQAGGLLLALSFGLATARLHRRSANEAQKMDVSRLLVKKSEAFSVLNTAQAKSGSLVQTLRENKATQAVDRVCRRVWQNGFWGNSRSPGGVLSLELPPRDLPNVVVNGASDVLEGAARVHAAPTQTASSDAPVPLPPLNERVVPQAPKSERREPNQSGAVALVLNNPSEVLLGKPPKEVHDHVDDLNKSGETSDGNESAGWTRPRQGRHHLTPAVLTVESEGHFKAGLGPASQTMSSVSASSPNARAAENVPAAGNERPASPKGAHHLTAAVLTVESEGHFKAGLGPASQTMSSVSASSPNARAAENVPAAGNERPASPTSSAGRSINSPLTRRQKEARRARKRRARKSFFQSSEPAYLFSRWHVEADQQAVLWDGQQEIYRQLIPFTGEDKVDKSIGELCEVSFPGPRPVDAAGEQTGGVVYQNSFAYYIRRVMQSPGKQDKASPAQPQGEGSDLQASAGSGFAP
jgi:hypothetical protein